MTEKQALLVAINTINDMANEFLDTYYNMFHSSSSSV